jgi:thioredoxin reductase
MKHHRIAIIGAGPAGMSCAIQLKRMGLDPVVFERPEPSSMLRMANKVENYLGFPQGIRGEELYRLFCEQFERFQVEVIYKEVKKASFREDVFILDNEDESFSCDILVVASGTRPLRRVISAWDENIDKYLHYDISRIPLQDRLSVGIIGLGDAAFDYALNMHRRGHLVQIFGRSEKVLANKALLDQFRKTGGIPLNFSHVLISMEESADRIRCRFRNRDEVAEHVLDCLIFATGREASTDLLDEDILEQIDSLYQLKRLFLAGDVKNGDFRQTAIATGDGIRIAMEIARNESTAENGA